MFPTLLVFVSLVHELRCVSEDYKAAEVQEWWRSGEFFTVSPTIPYVGVGLGKESGGSN